MKKFISFVFIIFILLLMLCLCIFPDRYITECLNGIKLWAICVLPSLLPFFFLTALLTSTGSLSKITAKLNPLSRKIFNCSGISAYVHIMSLLSGYPVGARLIKDLHSKGFITTDEGTRMSTFCSTSGPLFIVGSVGVAMFNNKQFAMVFLIVHILSSIMCGLIFRRYGDNRTACGHLKTANSDNILYECIYQSVITIIIVGGFVAIFYTLSQILYDFKILFIFEQPLSLLIGKTNAQGFVQGLVECTMGCKKLASNPTVLSASLAAALIAFGGASVICQSIAFLKGANVKISIFLLSKLIQMVISFILCFIFLKLFY